jgi:transposase
LPGWVFATSDQHCAVLPQRRRGAAERLAALHTPEGSPLPPNVSAELQRDMARLGFVVSQIKEIEGARQKRLETEPESGPHVMVRRLARIVGVGIETADMLVHEVLSRRMRDRKAAARFAGLTGAPDESGAKRREQGLAKAGNARIRRGMIQLAWRFLLFQKSSALIHGGRWLAEEDDSVITNDVNAHGWSRLFHVSAVPIVTTHSRSRRGAKPVLSG